MKVPDYMVSFSTGWNFAPPSRLKCRCNYVRNVVAITCPISVSETGLGFSVWANGLTNPCNREDIFPSWLKKERELAHRLCFRISVNFLMEICVLCPGWNWGCNRNSLSVLWVERNFSPSWDSPFNQVLSSKFKVQSVLLFVCSDCLSVQVNWGFLLILPLLNNAILHCFFFC